MIKLSDYVIQTIADLGVRHVFFVPGGAAMHLNDSLGRCAQIEYVSNLHEQASAIAAEAYARVTNNLGVAMVTAGPGGTNAITGVAGAWLDSTPCLFLSGQVKTADLKRDLGVRQLGVQRLDIVTIVSSITKYAVTITDPKTIRYHLEKAIHLAQSGRKGPVWLDIPMDVQAAQIEPEQQPGFVPELPAAAAIPNGAIERVIELLNAAERPVLLAGNGIRVAGAEKQFVELVELLGIPVLTTWLGLDLLPEAHPLYAGRPGSIAPRGANFTLQNSDFLLTIGSRLDMALTAYAHDRLARAAKKVIVDIDAAEIAKFKAPVELPIVADAREFIEALLARRAAIAKRDRSAWTTRVQQWKAKWPLVLPEHRERTDRVSTYYFAEVMSEELEPGELLVPGSSGNGVEAFFLVFQLKVGQRMFHNRGLGAMGYALPSAIGGCLAAGRRRTISVDGDGGFQFNIQELETVHRMNLPIKYFVLNNQGYASIRASQRNYFGDPLIGCDAGSNLSLPDLVKVATAYGIHAHRIENHADMRQQIRHALDAPGPCVCEVMVVPDEIRVPRISSWKRDDGSMASKPLEDLFPFLDRDEFRANMLIPILED